MKAVVAIRLLPAVRVLIGALTLWALLGGRAPAVAQTAGGGLAVSPSSVAATVEQHEAAARTITLTNTGSASIAFCLSFQRPLEEGPDGPVLSEDALSSACGIYGEVLAQVSQQDLGIGWGPYGITMTPGGRIFTADSYDGRTHELAPELELVRSFEHPTVAEVVPFPATTGVTYNTDTGTLWWMNIENSGFDVRRSLLLEGDLDGTPTGRQIEVPIAETAPEPYEEGVPVGASYDAQTDRYYFVDFANDDLWAVDTLGNVIDGYPAEQQAYPGAQLGRGFDAHRLIGEGTLEDPGALRFELGLLRPGDTRVTRVVVLASDGSTEGIETPVPVLDETGSQMSGPPVRSRVDPNGVMYYPYSSFDLEGVVAVRPHPLPPSWLAMDAWDGTLEPGESREIALTFLPGQRAVGDYTAVLQAFEAESGTAVEVPLSLAVTQGTDAEGEAARPEAPSLTIHPNPTTGRATVTLSLAAAETVRVEVLDVLGRVVARLHDGRLGAGTHTWTVDAADLLAGRYVVRVSGGVRATRPVTVLR